MYLSIAQCPSMPPEEMGATTRNERRAAPLFFFALTMLRPYFLRAYPAVPLIFGALTPLYPLFS